MFDPHLPLPKLSLNIAARESPPTREGLNLERPCAIQGFKKRGRVLKKRGRVLKKRGRVLKKRGLVRGTGRG